MVRFPKFDLFTKRGEEAPRDSQKVSSILVYSNLVYQFMVYLTLRKRSYHEKTPEKKEFVFEGT